VDFLEEDEPFAPADAERPSRRYTADRQRQIMVRRIAAVGIGVLVLILLLLGIRGCLDARQERGFENYASDLGTYAAQSSQLSQEFFGRLEDPKNLTALSFEAEVQADAGSAEGLLNNVRGLDTPGDLEDAQADLELAFELRRDALSGIANRISDALGEERQNEATKAIAANMKVLLASDVLYARAQMKIVAELEDQDISAEVPDSQFLPDPVERWLDPLQVGQALGQVQGGGEVAPGLHGLGLLQTLIQPGDVVLDPDAPATISADGPVEIVAQVQNQGENEETDVFVTFELTGATETISGESSISRIAPGETVDVQLPVSPDPPTGEELTLEVLVEPVDGEEIEDNNRATYTVTFE
jgi:CARDB